MTKVEVMKGLKRIVLLGLCMAGCSHPGADGGDREMDRFVDSLLSEMTLEEKIGQLNLVPVDGSAMTGPVTESATGDRIAKGEIGALLNVMSPAKMLELQQAAVTESRLGIPLLFGMDVIHGYNTVFPIPLGLSATWNPESIERSARISAVEASAQGVNWTFSPMVDISFDPRWGRVAEGSGEDPYLASLIAAAYVRGYQGDLSRNDQILACVKHFALYGAPEGGRDYNSVDMSRQRMYTDYFPPYRSAVEAGAGSVMAAFNDVEGVPAAANEWLLGDVLRRDWGFDGFVVSDWDAVREMTVHGIGDLQEVSARGLRAGLDMDMASQGLWGTLKASLDAGEVRMEEVDRACRRILRAKYRLGLFCDPYKYHDTTRVRSDVFTPEHRAEARRIAAESFVLLKNENNTLPIRRKGTIAVVGPLADSRANMPGTWSVAVDLTKPHTVLEGLREIGGSDVNIRYARGCNIARDEELERNSTIFDRTIERDGRSDREMLEEALRISSDADVIVAVLGEPSEMSGECSSRSDIGIPDVQRELLEALVATGKPVVLVLFAGRPMTLEWEDEHVTSILNVWFGGTQAAEAIGDVLFGDVNPSGKLPSTFPRNVGQIPLFYNHKNTGRPLKGDKFEKFRSAYLDVPNTPVYAFGHGLSYTTFRYGDIRLSASEMGIDGSITVTVRLTNDGPYAGEEVVQLYIRDIQGSSTRPVQELKGFQRVSLKPGESRDVNFKIDASLLKFYNYDLDYVCEPGEFDIMIGGASDRVKQTRFRLN